MSAEDKAKLKILLKHWVEHNKEHEEEFAIWADKARIAGASEAADSILGAVRAMDKAGDYLAQALRALGED